MALLIFLLILSLLVLVHEFGHFIVAKKSGVLVEEFGLGIPPKIFGKKIGETEYTLNALPFGGFVRLFGEDPTTTTPELLSSPRSFLSKAPLVRVFILTAGVLMNFLLAVFLYYVLFTITNFKSLSLPIFFEYQFKYGEVIYTDTIVSGFIEESPAQHAGIDYGDAIIEIDGVPVTNLDDIKNQVSMRPNSQVSVVVKDIKSNLKLKTKTVEFTTAQTETGEGVLGVYITSAANILYRNKLIAPFQHAYNMTAYTFHTLGEFIKLSAETKSISPVSNSVAGPVGIYSVVSGILTFGGADAYLGLLDFTALLSLSLAFMNILPLPALDGGRLIFVLVELISKKRINQTLETAVHKWGMVFFFGLLILITLKDIFIRLPF